MQETIKSMNFFNKFSPIFIYIYIKDIAPHIKLVPSLTYLYFYNSTQDVFAEQTSNKAKLNGFVAWTTDFLVRSDKNDDSNSNAEKYAPTVNGKLQIFGGNSSSSSENFYVQIHEFFRLQLLLRPSFSITFFNQLKF